MSLYYQDEHVTLYHGDCLTEHREWLDADVLVTDPPYGMSFKSGRRKGVSLIAGDTDTEARDNALRSWGNQPWLSFGRWSIDRPRSTKAVLIWDKVNPGMGDVRFPWAPTFEEIYAGGEWPDINPGGRRREGGNPARSSNVLRCPTINSQATSRPDHPTPKPVPLMERLIERCPPGVIADPFAGSGATLIAARNLGRKAVGVELEERYCEIIARRLQQGAFDFTDTA